MTNFTITGSANDTNLVVGSNSATVSDSGYAVSATASASVTALAAAATNAADIAALQGSDVSLNFLITDLQSELNVDPVTAPGVPYISSLLATPTFGQYYTGPYRLLGGTLADGFRLALEYYASKNNNSVNMRYLEFGYDVPTFFQKMAPYYNHSVLTLPHSSGALNELLIPASNNSNNQAFEGAILAVGYNYPILADFSNNIDVFSYDTGVENLVTDLSLNSSNVLCVINWSLPFPGKRGTGYQGGATPALKKHGSRLVFHDATGAVIVDASSVPLDTSGDDPNGPVVRIFEIAHPMNGQVFAAWGITAAQSDCSVALDVINGYVTAGQNVNILVRTWGEAGIDYINATILAKGLADKTIFNWWSLPIPDASMVGMRQMQCAVLDPTSDFVTFVNTKAATYSTNSNLFSQGVLEAVLTVKLLDAAGNNPTQASVVAAALSLSLTQAQIAADGFGNLVAGNLGLGLKLSKLFIKTIDASGNFDLIQNTYYTDASYTYTPYGVNIQFDMIMSVNKNAKTLYYTKQLENGVANGTNYKEISFTEYTGSSFTTDLSAEMHGLNDISATTVIGAVPDTTVSIYSTSAGVNQTTSLTKTTLFFDGVQIKRGLLAYFPTRSVGSRWRLLPPVKNDAGEQFLTFNPQ